MINVSRCVALGLALAAPPALAGEPLYAKNLSPISGLLGLPSQRSATTGSAGRLALDLHLGVANHYAVEAREDEAVNLDGETLRLALEARYAFSERWEVQLEVPFLDHSGGHLDSLIDNWHSFWGMSDGGRPDVDRDLLDYRYGSAVAYSGLEDDSSGLGDVSLALNYAFYQDDGAAASVAVGYKFGTGEEAQFLGSGSDDVYLALRFSGEQRSDVPLTWHGQVGYLRAGDIEGLSAAQESDLWFAGLSVDWALWTSVSLLAQLDLHAAPLDSKLTAVGDDAVLLTLGGRWAFAPRWSLDVSFIEDVRVETGPDITFQASVRYRPGS